MNKKMLYLICIFILLLPSILLADTSSIKEMSSIIYPKEPTRYKMYDLSAINNEKRWTVNNVHDPSIIKAGDWYYLFSTDVKVGGIPAPGIQIRKSKDLINWMWVGYVFKGVPEEAKKWTDAENLWAPDIIRVGDYYFLYYAASQFGKNQSFIGLAISKSPEGPWIDKGEVFKTRQGDIPNSIDPNVTFDAEGNLWMVYGSFFGGIYVSKLDKDTGKLAEYGKGTLIARRSMAVRDAIEGPFIIYNPLFKKYYLFISYDSLFRDYNIRVARADKITGPYTDYNGNVMTDTNINPNDVGTKILSGYRFNNDDGWIAPGHNSVLVDGDDYYIVHHARPALNKNWMYLHVRKVLWSDDGWPLVSPERYAGERIQEIPKDLVVGTWERIVLDPYVREQALSTEIKLLNDGKIESPNNKGYWEFKSPNTLKLTWVIDEKGKNYEIETVKVIPAWD